MINEDRDLNVKKSGSVSLVGAGPGDPGLLTVRGVEALSEADIVVYDYLANPVLLDYAPAGCEHIYVGKKAGSHTLTQDEIDALLVELARAGKRVVRLKGGDPFVFGRGGEEALALVAAGIDFEVVPGVTSAVAAPAYAGIPVTHRGLATSFAVITGHEDPTKNESGIDWVHLACGVDTLVFLMGVGNLPDIVRQLVAHGRPEDTPAALVRWGTLARQETVSGTLADIVERVRAAGLKPPAVTIVGKVAGLRDQLRWFEERPLFGHRVLVTRTRQQASALSRRLRPLGAEPVELPTIEIAPPADWAPLDAAIQGLHAPGFDWIVFTSVNGVSAFFERLDRAGLDARALAGTRLAAIGPATAASLTEHSVRADCVPGEYVAEAVAAALGDVTGKRVLLPRADIARQALTDLLRSGGATVVEVDAYRTVQPAVNKDELSSLLTSITLATFTSSSTVRNLASMARTAGLRLPEAISHTTVACIGPITAATARQEGLPVHIVAKEYTIDGLIRAIVDHQPAVEEIGRSIKDKGRK